MADTRKSKKDRLRQKGNKSLSNRFRNTPKIPGEDLRGLVHQLQVRQSGLEMQNEELRKAQEEIDESRTKYSDPYDFAPVGYFTFSQAGEILEVNLTGASLLGIDRKKLLHRPFSVFVDPKFRSLFRHHCLNVLSGIPKERCELKVIKKDGESFHASFESISVPHGGSIRIRSAVSDITELRKAQQKAETEHAFRIAIENCILSGIAAVDLDGRQSYVNTGFCRMVGWSEEELIGRKLPFAYWPPEELDHHQIALRTVMDGKAPREGLELRFMRKNRERFDGMVLPSSLKDPQGKVIGWIGTIGDITHLKQMEKELKQLNMQLEERVRQRTVELETANQQLKQEIIERRRTEEALGESEKQLRYLSSQLLTAQETERRRIARELHDDLGGALAVLKLRCSSIGRNLKKKDKTGLREECKENLEYIDQIIENVGRLSRNLSPTILQDLGFSAALGRLIESFSKNYDIAAACGPIDIDGLLPTNAQIMIYRIFQEALTNVGKHSHARNVSVKANKDEETISFSIVDDGKGFDVIRATLEKGSERGLGLATIDERARMLGGSLDLWSEEGSGTRITFHIPIKKGESLR